MTEEELEHLRRSKERVGAFQHVFAGDKGKLVLRDLAHESGFLRPLYGRDGINANDVLVNEGRRSLFLYILSVLEIDFEEVEKLILTGSE